MHYVDLLTDDLSTCFDLTLIFFSFFTGVVCSLQDREMKNLACNVGNVDLFIRFNIL